MQDQAPGEVLPGEVDQELGGSSGAGVQHGLLDRRGHPLLGQRPDGVQALGRQPD